MLSRRATLGMVNGKDKTNIKESIERSQDFPIAQMVNNLPAVQEMWVRSLGQGYPLKMEMAILSSLENPMDRGA